MLAWRLPDWRSNCPACASAGPRSSPVSGINAGLSGGNRPRIVATSDVSGTTVCASPAKAMSPTRASRAAPIRSSIAKRARVARSGETSATVIEGDRSSTTTQSSGARYPMLGRRCQAGPAMASTLSVQTAAKKSQGPVAARPESSRRTATSSASMIFDQAPARDCRMRSQAANSSNGSASRSHTGCRK